MKYAVISLLMSIPAFSSYAQSSFWNKNQLQLTATPQYAFNMANVDNDGKGYDPISSKNELVYNVGLEYTRLLKFGFTISAGLRYGVIKHDIHLHTDLSTFDPEAKENLKGAAFDKDVNLRYNYLSPRIMIGYRKDFNKKWSVQCAYGVSKKKYRDGRESMEAGAIDYKVDDKNEIRSSQFIAYNTFFSKPGRKIISTYSGDDLCHEFYFGISKGLDRKFFHFVNIGIEATRNWGNPKNGSTLFTYTTSTWQDRLADNFSLDSYRNRGLTLGLRLGIGL